MDKSKHDLGLIQAILEKLNTQSLPRLLTMKQHVDAGQKLDYLELYYLETSMSEVRFFLSLAERETEYLRLVSHVINLYSDIATEALKLEN